MRNIIISFVVMIMLSSAIASAEDTYTYTSKTSCDAGRCTVTLGDAYAFDVDGRWKPVTEAISLKNSTIRPRYLKVDKDYGIEILDYNAKFKSIRLTVGIGSIGKPVPLTITGITNRSVNALFLSNSMEYVIESGLTDKLKFGPNSTIIDLSYEGTELLDDTIVVSSAPTTNYGNAVILYLINQSTISYTHLSRFNLTPANLNASANIMDSSMCIKQISSSLDNTGEGYYISVRWLYQNWTMLGGEWDEANITYARRPQGINVNMTDYMSDTLNFSLNQPVTGNTWFCFNVTDIVSGAKLQNDVEFITEAHDYYGTPSTDDHITLVAKEGTGQAGMVFNITYDYSLGEENETEPEVPPVNFTIPVERVFCTNEKYLYRNIIAANDSGFCVDDYEYLTECQYGCANSTWTAFGGPGCKEGSWVVPAIALIFLGFIAFIVKAVKR